MDAYKIIHTAHVLNGSDIIDAHRASQLFQEQLKKAGKEIFHYKNSKGNHRHLFGIKKDNENTLRCSQL